MSRPYYTFREERYGLRNEQVYEKRMAKNREVVIQDEKKRQVPTLALNTTLFPTSVTPSLFQANLVFCFQPSL